MCVIVIVDNGHKRPTKDEVEMMWDKNWHGGGVAWFEGKELKWQKGIMQKEEMINIAAELPAPFVLHFRLNSVGGHYSSLTHPFPVTPSVNLALDGKTTDHSVLFHNGTWSKWRDETLRGAIGLGYRIPGGRWSDTRAIALLAAHYGIGAIEMIEEKVVVCDPRLSGGNRITLIGSGWEMFEKRFVVSNKYWLNANYYTDAGTRWEGGQQQKGQQTMTPSSCTLPAVPQPIAVTPVLPVQEQKLQTPVATLTGGGPAAVVPFVQPLTFYEERFKQGQLTQKAYAKIKKYYTRINRNPTGQSTKPKAMLELEQSLKVTH